MLRSDWAADPRCVDREGRRAVALGFIMALLLVAVPFVRFVFSYLGILFHELGHAAAWWLFGYPAVPAFDFLFGGGVTVHQDRSLLLLLAVLAAIGALLYSVRAHHRLLAVLGALAGLYLLLALTPLHEGIAIAMGHGMELALAGVFLYRGLSGSGLKIPVERPLYAAFGFFVVFLNLGLAGRILGDEAFRRLYAAGKGGCLRHDLEILGTDFLPIGLSGAAGILMLCCLATPGAAWLLHRHGNAFRHRLATLLA